MQSVLVICGSVECVLCFQSFLLVKQLFVSVFSVQSVLITGKSCVRYQCNQCLILGSQLSVYLFSVQSVLVNADTQVPVFSSQWWTMIWSCPMTLQESHSSPWTIFLASLDRQCLASQPWHLSVLTSLNQNEELVSNPNQCILGPDFDFEETEKPICCRQEHC